MNNKDIATDFLQMVVGGEVDQAYEKYTDMSGKHHNVYTLAGFAALRDAMKESNAHFPNKQFTIKNVFADGPMVAVHSHLLFDPQTQKELSVVHMFRFNDAGKIVELWDVGQDIPSDSPNTDGAF